MTSLFDLDYKEAVFKDRIDAGKQLSSLLKEYAGKNSIILAIPRGGVVVGHQISKALNIPLQVIVTRKIGAPHNPELAIGAISEGNVQVLDKKTLRYFSLSEKDVSKIVKLETKELNRRIKLYRGNKLLPQMHNKVVILVDDGLATGLTAQASIKSILKLHPLKIIFAAPVCAFSTAKLIQEKVDEVLCLQCPNELQAIGLYYSNFSQTTDEEVIKLLKQRPSLNYNI